MAKLVVLGRAFMRPGFHLVLLCAALACTSVRALPARASAFLQAPGRGQVIVEAFSDGAAAAFDARGRVIPISAWQKFELSASGEFGLTDRLTLLASSAYDLMQDSTEPPGSARGLGISALGARVLLASALGWTLSSEVSLRLPGTQVGSWIGAPDGTRALETRLMAGRALALFGRTGFVDVEAGLRLHPAGVAEVLFDGTLGLQVLPRWMVLAQAFGREASGGGIAPRFSEKLQASLVYSWRPDLSIQFGGFATVLARNDALERGFLSAVWYRF